MSQTRTLAHAITTPTSRNAFWMKIMTDCREIIWFKQAPEGYVFRAPNRWVFGRARYFW